MTADEPEAISDSPADDDLWLTYLNYDQRIQQAVRRLSALSSANVDEFRAQLLKGRDRSRVQEYEAESIRRLQGEGFVGDEELQRALIVLTAEDPRLGEELKRVVGAEGKPQELDQTIAAIRQRMSGGAAIAVAPSAGPTPVKPAPAVMPEPVRQPQPTFTPAAAVRMQTAQAQTSRTKPLVIAAVIAVVALAAGLVWLKPMLAPQSAPRSASPQTASVALRPSTADEAAPASADRPAPPAQATPPAQTAVPVKPAPTAQAEAKIAAPAETPDKAASPDSAPTSTTPVPGSYYKVVRGDMLSQIALTAYRDASKFPVIQRANPGLRYGPDKILVDQVIFVPPVP